MTDPQDRADAEIIGQAVKDGKISASYAPVWMNSMKADRAGTKRVLSAMSGYSEVNGVPRSASKGRISNATRPNSPTRRTAQTMNAELYADPELHRAAWAMGIRDIKPPPETIHVCDFGIDDSPQLVVDADGTGRYVSRPTDYTGTILADDSTRQPTPDDFNDIARKLGFQ